MSVPANIVEGSGQHSDREFSRFLRIALNSTTELEYHLITARDLRLILDTDTLTLTNQLIEIRKMIYGLLRHLASKSKNRVTHSDEPANSARNSPLEPHHSASKRQPL